MVRRHLRVQRERRGRAAGERATVKTHLDRLMTKLGVSSRAQAVVVADRRAWSARAADHQPAGNARPNSLRSAVFAACRPAMPCTPGPGGVALEQR